MAWVEQRGTRWRVRLRMPDGTLGTDSSHPTRAAAQLRCKQVDIDQATDTHPDPAAGRGTLAQRVELWQDTHLAGPAEQAALPNPPPRPRGAPRRRGEPAPRPPQAARPPPRRPPPRFRAQPPPPGARGAGPRTGLPRPPRRPPPPIPLQPPHLDTRRLRQPGAWDPP